MRRSIDSFQNQGQVNLNEFEKKVFSQNDEDGITMKLIELIYDDPRNKYYVEFGVENGNECNTRVLRERYGWKGLLMDGSNENDSINLKKEFITKDNVVSLFERYNVPKHFELLCVDIDYNDYYCLAKLLKSYTCDIIIAEYNAHHSPSEDKVVKYEASTMWDGSDYFGASLRALNNLCSKHGYTLVYCDSTGTNSFFVANKYVSKLNIANAGNIDAIYRPTNYGKANRGHPPDGKKRAYITSAEADAIV